MNATQYGYQISPFPAAGIPAVGRVVQAQKTAIVVGFCVLVNMAVVMAGGCWALLVFVSWPVAVGFGVFANMVIVLTARIYLRRLRDWQIYMEVLIAQPWQVWPCLVEPRSRRIKLLAPDRTVVGSYRAATGDAFRNNGYGLVWIAGDVGATPGATRIWVLRPEERPQRETATAEADPYIRQARAPVVWWDLTEPGA
jgi:hypothetical protein